MLPLPIYMDNHATTRVDPRVVEAMLPFFTVHYGNAASRNHSFGRDAEAAVEAARREVAAIVGANEKEIFFTSGATESNNLAIKGVAAMYRRKGNHILTVATEHSAVLDVVKRLERDGLRATYLPVDRYGQLVMERLADAITKETILVSVMAANNEIGTLARLAEIGALCKAHDIFFHCDAAQAAGKIPLDVAAMGIDLLSMSAHKMYGPKGIGALYVRRRDPHVRLEPMMDGGGHERGIRSGTLAVPNIVGFGKACALSAGEMTEETQRLSNLRDRLHQGITSQLEQVHLNGHPEERLAGNLNLSFAYVDGEALMMAMKDVAVSSGSACTTATPGPSHVLKAIGLSDDLARSSIRFGLGRFNTEEQVDFVIGAVVQAVRRLRALSPMYEMAQQSDVVNRGKRM